MENDTVNKPRLVYMSKDGKELTESQVQKICGNEKVHWMPQSNKYFGKPEYGEFVTLQMHILFECFKENKRLLDQKLRMNKYSKEEKFNLCMKYKELCQSIDIAEKMLDLEYRIWNSNKDKFIEKK